ncbi:MAG: type IV pilin protein [Betaproteobacteria bacterium]|nr:type IV pilin protein [Betaproteobacteria bacterium]
MNTQKGFTLLELMIVVMVIAILAAVAIPNYQSYTIKTRRATAAACLVELSQALERFHTVNMTYTGSALPILQCNNDLKDHYTFSLTSVAARAYTLSAAPQGAQSSNDPASCGTLTINQAGQKGASGDVNACWK